MNDVMIDLETWGVNPGCGIRSIGGVFFDPKSEQTGAEAYCNVDRESCRVAGLREERKTLDWWERQSAAAKEALQTNPIPVYDALERLNRWLLNNCEDVKQLRLWCHGAIFDEPITSAAMRILYIEPVWQFYNVRCTRTLYEAYGLDPRTVGRLGTHHNALDDARHQVRCVQMAHLLQTSMLERAAWREPEEQPPRSWLSRAIFWERSR